MLNDVVFDTYRPGVLGEVAAWHGRYYAEHWNFGPFFEATVSAGLGEFALRMDQPGSRLLSAWINGDFAGSISVDNDQKPDLGTAHLRWFIMSDAARGKKIGRPLFDQAMTFIKDTGYKGAYLTTFKGLEPAAKLYRDFGFELTAEEEGQSWGTPVLEQRYEFRF